jgi:hypothetical protein
MMSPIDPTPAVVYPISDPPLYRADVIVLSAALILGVASIVKGGPRMDEVNRKARDVSTYMLYAPVFLALVMVPIFYYPGFHAWWVATFGHDFYLGWTIYHPQKFGGVHMPSFVLSLVVGAAVILTPSVTALIQLLAAIAVRAFYNRYKAQQAELEIEVEA